MFVFFTQNHPNLLAYEEAQPPPHKALGFDMQIFPNRDITLRISEFTLPYFVQ
jgi:hypothetical protein